MQPRNPSIAIPWSCLLSILSKLLVVCCGTLEERDGELEVLEYGIIIHNTHASTFSMCSDRYTH